MIIPEILLSTSLISLALFIWTFINQWKWSSRVCERPNTQYKSEGKQSLNISGLQFLYYISISKCPIKRIDNATTLRRIKTRLILLIQWIFYWNIFLVYRSSDRVHNYQMSAFYIFSSSGLIMLCCPCIVELYLKLVCWNIFE